ncbi:hypothetical protein CROQUDRAFT_93705 [Cronartium quercuum f. sp. fusiforme G11]|uniref:Uncharacterized protein n=1 Tax=Cronartium quercuum f. sp. fusiforme G11 TaxID=708437 RepID=A0A9P6NEX8_9BASI|nr:hypothetical protein CROQUDRAFT_93705 [Cronartium quercuum f. sp. fusiforme G11]
MAISIVSRNHRRNTRAAFRRKVKAEKLRTNPHNANAILDDPAVFRASAIVLAAVLKGDVIFRKRVKEENPKQTGHSGNNILDTSAIFLLLAEFVLATGRFEHLCSYLLHHDST